MNTAVSRPAAYLLAVLSVAAACLVRWPLWPVMGAEHPYLFFYPAVIAAALYGGLWPGVLATFLAALSANFFFMEPRLSFALTGLGDAIGVVAFAVVGIVFSAAMQRLHRATARAVDESLAADRERQKLRTYAELLDLAPVMVRTVDGNVAFWNTGLTELYGFSRQEAVGRTSHELLRTVFPEPLEEILASLHRRDCWQGMLIHCRKDGSPIYVLSRWMLHRQDGGEPSVIEINTDITAQRAIEGERQKLIEELQRTAEAKDQFLAMLAHELRNPLAPIVNGMQILRMPKAEPQVRAGVIAMVERQSAHLKRLIDDLLSVSRINRGLFQLEKRPVDLGELARAEIENAKRDPAAAEITFLEHLPDAPVWVDGDAVRLSQALHNLLQNACKFTDPGGRIEVRLGSERPHAVMCIRDSGSGISQEDLPHIFEPFTQADRTLDRKKGGLGLGLTIVRGLVALHGGSVEASSSGLGQGAEFTIRLPLASGANRPKPAATDDGEAIPKRRVLVIEDNADAADTMRTLLELLGQDVRVAYSGSAGVEQAREWSPDVIFSDIGLPGMDGYAVAREVRKQAGDAVVLVALSGYGQEQDRSKAHAAGFDDHLTKPAALRSIQDILMRRAGSWGQLPIDRSVS